MTSPLDGTIILPDNPLSVPLRRRLLHVNGIGSDAAKQLRDLNRLAELTATYPLEVRGIHNQTHGFQADLLESFLGKAELYRFWPQTPAPDPSKDRRYEYAKLLGQLVTQDLTDDADILAIAQPSQLQQRPLDINSTADLTKLLDLSFLQKLGWGILPSISTVPFQPVRRVPPCGWPMKSSRGYRREPNCTLSPIVKG